MDDDLDRAGDVPRPSLPGRRCHHRHAQERARTRTRRHKPPRHRKAPARQAAAAIIDLDSRSQTLIRANPIQAIFIKTGRISTPGGLRIAA